MDHNFDPERLRPPEFVCQPDPRSTMWVCLDPADGSWRPIELSDHYAEILSCSLHMGVPEDISQQFETTRNVYLYSWFIYRFYTVAELQSLACLELALRDRLKDEIRAGKIGSQRKRPMLRALLKYAVDHGLIKNEGFKRWHQRGEIRARARFERQKILEMSEQNLSEMSWDDSEIQVLPEDLDWDYANVLVDHLPEIRNRYAHGSTNLHNLTLSTIEIVCEVINQLYPDPVQSV